ncbi:hypothetical protein V6N13_096449 [Hibiscus sabdariffa]
MVTFGSVENRFYYNVDFPKGHIAVKSFNAEVINEAGNPVPLHETYLHHWVVVRYFVREGVKLSELDDDHAKLNRSDIFLGETVGFVRILASSLASGPRHGRLQLIFPIHME